MEDKDFLLAITRVVKALTIMVVLLIVLAGVIASHHFLPSSFLSKPEPAVLSKAVVADEDLIKDGIHVKTGLLDGEGLAVVITHCTACHSAKMITQNKATKDGWRNMIRWMQETQNLWELGDNEEIILTYLATQYAPQKKGRRSNLTNIEWYELE
jgi:hypothetical protein